MVKVLGTNTRRGMDKRRDSTLQVGADELRGRRGQAAALWQRTERFVNVSRGNHVGPSGSGYIARDFRNYEKWAGKRVSYTWENICGAKKFLWEGIPLPQRTMEYASTVPRRVAVMTHVVDHMFAPGENYTFRAPPIEGWENFRVYHLRVEAPTGASLSILHQGVGIDSASGAAVYKLRGQRPGDMYDGILEHGDSLVISSDVKVQCRVSYSWGPKPAEEPIPQQWVSFINHSGDGEETYPIEPIETFCEEPNSVTIIHGKPNDKDAWRVICESKKMCYVRIR